MTLTFRSSHVQTPSIAPSVSSGSGAYIFAHRRVNRLGRYSALSPVTVSSTFPVTLTPQSYADTNELIRDEFLVSDSGGAIWRIIPRTGSQLGSQTVTTYDVNWVVASIEDNQNLPVNAGDLGLFDADGSETFTMFVHNAGQNIGSLTANILNPANNTIYAELTNLVQISLQGVLVANGTGVYSTANNRVINWGISDSNNTFPLSLPTNAVAKFSIRLVNLPSSGIANPSFDLNFTADKRTATVSFDRNWLNNSLLFSPDIGFGFPILTNQGVSANQVIIKPFSFNFQGTAINNPLDRLFTVDNGDRKVVVNRLGEISILQASAALTTNQIELVSFTISGSTVSNINYKVNFRPLIVRNRVVTSGTPGDFIRLNSSGNIVVS